MKKSIIDLTYNLIKAKPLVSLFLQTRKLRLTWHHLDDSDSKVQSHDELVHYEIYKHTFQYLEGIYFVSYRRDYCVRLINLII